MSANVTLLFTWQFWPGRPLSGVKDLLWALQSGEKLGLLQPSKGIIPSGLGSDMGSVKSESHLQALKFSACLLTIVILFFKDFFYFQSRLWAVKRTQINPDLPPSTEQSSQSQTQSSSSWARTGSRTQQSGCYKKERRIRWMWENAVGENQVTSLFSRVF